MVPGPNPEGVTVHQVWLLVTVHAAVEVTANVVDPAEDVTGRSDGETASDGGAFSTGFVARLKVFVVLHVSSTPEQGVPVYRKTLVG